MKDMILNGALNPAWIQRISSSDPAVTRIRAFYLPGPKLKQDVQCSADPCVMPTRISGFINEQTLKEEFNPMMFCFFCDRSFHVGCYNLDAGLLLEEKVPWRCKDCSSNIQNPFASKYSTESSYKTKMKKRRSKFLRDTVIPEDGDKEYDTDAEFESADRAAFRRRALQIAATTHDTTVNLVTLDETTGFEMLQHSIMRAKADEQRTQETNRRIVSELAVEQKRRRESEAAMAELERKFKELTQGKEKVASLSSSTRLHPPQINVATTSGTTLSDFYLSGDTTASNETNTFAYHPEPVNVEPIEPIHISANANNSNNTELTELLSRLTATQERNEERQMLTLRRKAAPKIADFHGDPAKWLAFQQDVTRYKENCGYDDGTVKLYVRGALKGEAFELVKDIVDKESLQFVMAVLKSAYGDEMMLIRKYGEELKKFKLDSSLYRSQVIKLQASIQSYFSACNYAKIGYLNTNELGEAIFSQFNAEDRQRCKEFYRIKNPDSTTIVICLRTIYEYLLMRLPLLDDISTKQKDKANSGKDDRSGKKTYNVHSIENSHIGNPVADKDGYKFELRDKSTAIYIGYDMAKVNALTKKCEICSRANHFTFQCPQYRALDEKGRMKIINEKNLCKSCVVTNSHKANACDIKAGCGMKLNRYSRCTQKHHISIHSAADRPKGTPGKNKSSNRNRKPSNTNTDANNAPNNVQNQTPAQQPNVTTAEINFHALPPVEVKRKYEVIPLEVNAGAMDAKQTVKVFKVKFFGPNGVIEELAIGDSGSEVSVIREDLREALGIQGTACPLSLQWSDSSKRSSDAKTFDLKLQGVSRGCQQHVLKNCFAVTYLNLAHRSLDMQALKRQFPYLADVEFESYFNKQPVMLIGSPHAYLMEGNGMLLEGGDGAPVALTTKLGWTVYGGTMLPNFTVSNVANETMDDPEPDELVETQQDQKVTNEDLKELLERFHSIEALGIKPKESALTEDERKAVELLENEMQISNDGKVEVPLIWNTTNGVIPELPNNYAMALRRQLGEEKKLSKNPDLFKAYVNNVKELMDLKFLRYATNEDMNTKWKNVWYLPMYPVINANKVPPKMRLVYDASATYHGVSLNSKLLKGPDLLVNILDPLLRMRMSRYAFTADVSKMFHMMKICKRDQQCQRILFRENPDSPMRTLILDVMGFGMACSPFVSQFIKNWNADRWMDKYQDAANTLKCYTYMDDVLTSEPTLEKSIEIAKQCIEICKDIGWDLVSFQSNSVELLQALPHDMVKRDVIPLLESKIDSLVTKVLGCSWNTKSDCFEFNLDKNLFVKLVTEFDHKPTKRDQASTIARIYDSLGFISNYTILGKILMQRSWQLKLDWDDQIPVEEANLWKEWLEGIKSVSNMKFNRQYTTLNSILEADEVQLHVFCDAGAEAFGAVAYLVVIKGDKVDSNIVMAKAKVTPLRMKTKTSIAEMPRLELLAALIAARLSDKIIKAYHQIDIKRFFWSDSEVVLRWILNENHRLLKYAIAPVEEILDLTNRIEWRYVPTKSNPADLCTKYRKFDIKVANSTWMNGPEFIKFSPDKWPKMPEKLLKDESYLINNIFLETLNYSTYELPPIDCPFATDAAIDQLSPSIQAKWTKLLRATARALKLFMDGFIPVVKIKQLSNLEFLKKLRKVMSSYSLLTSTDLERAEHFIFRKIQRESFPEEYNRLQNGQYVRNKDFQQLSVFMDQEGLLRINSRVDLNAQNFPQQYAPLLPRKNAIVSIFLMHYHQKFRHIALESQIAEVRTRCWIPQLRTAMRSIKSKCNDCNVRNAQPYEPIMAPLPDYRTNPEAKPFEVTGVDVLGPIIINRCKKIYILIFVCALTRFVHLHILESLESLRVLEAIVVFWTAHGPVRKFVSDNGTNFRGAAKILRDDYVNSKLFIRDSAAILQPKLSELYCIEWEFISAYAPWFGGLYERLIKEVKRALHGTLQDRRVHKIELNIAIQETAHRLNCRPLVENSLDAMDEEILTPHHLAKNRSGWPLLAGLHKNKFVQVDDRSLYRKGRILADDIMRKFVSYHLPTLTKKTKWHKSEGSIKVNDLVLMIEPNQTRSQWPRGKVIKLHRGRDGIVRSADIILGNGKIKLKRAVRNLAKLKLSPHPSESPDVVRDVNCIFTENSDIMKYELSPNQNYQAVEQSYLYFTKFSFQIPILLVETMENQRNQIASKHLRIEGPSRRIKKPREHQECSIKVILLSNVSVCTPLSDILRSLQNNCTSVVGIFRSTDCHSGTQDTLVYLYVYNVLEAENLVEMQTFFLNGQIIRVSDPKLVPGTAEFRVNVLEGGGDDIRGAPMPVGIFRLRCLPLITTFYVIELLSTFEEVTQLAGIRIAYDEHSKKTRSFGMLAMLTRIQLRDMLNRKFEVFGETIVTDFTNRTQVLLPEQLAHKFNKHRQCELTREVQRENRLSFDVYDLNIRLEPRIPAIERRQVVLVDQQPKDSNAVEVVVPESGKSGHVPEGQQPNLSISKAVEPIATEQIPGPSKPKRARKQNMENVEMNALSSSVSALSIGDNYQLEEDGKISRGQ